MRILTRENVLDHCRTCLTNFKKCEENEDLIIRYHLKTTQDLGKWVEDLTSLPVLMASDEYPQYICDGCYSIFKTVHDFQQFVWQVSDKLKDLLEIPKKEPFGYYELDTNNTLKPEMNSVLKVNKIFNNHPNGHIGNTSTQDSDLDESSTTNEQQYKIEKEFESHGTEFISENINCQEKEIFLSDDSFDDAVDLIEEQKLQKILKTGAVCRTPNISPVGNSIKLVESEKNIENINASNYYEICSSDESSNEHETNKQNTVSYWSNQAHNELRPHVCQFCNKRFTRKGTLNQHERLHTGEKPYVCDVCNRSFVQSVHLKIHKISKHELHQNVNGHENFKEKTSFKARSTNSNQCSICKKKFKKKHSLKVHISKAHKGCVPARSKNLNECEICQKVFSNKYVLKTHESTVHNDIRSFACIFCELSFKTSSTLKTHERIHTGEKPYICSVCDSSFSQLAHLQKHSKLHKNSFKNTFISSKPICQT